MKKRIVETYILTETVKKGDGHNWTFRKDCKTRKVPKGTKFQFFAPSMDEKIEKKYLDDPAYAGIVWQKDHKPGNAELFTFRLPVNNKLFKIKEYKTYEVI